LTLALVGAIALWSNPQSDTTPASAAYGMVKRSLASNQEPRATNPARAPPTVLAPVANPTASNTSAASQPLPPTAAQTMADARLKGDDRAPPIFPTTPDDEALAPTPWDMNDPARYHDYEKRRQRRVEDAYMQAAQQRLPAWRAALADARARGASAQELAAAQDKIQRLEAAQALLRAGTGAPNAQAGPASR
jgi:hypothetical protein